MEAILEVSQVTKRYHETAALDGVSMRVAEGSCFGLLGPNGAGKSTMMKIITGILDADKGTVQAFRMDTHKHVSAIRRLIGYVPQEITLYDKLNAVQNLTFFGEMYGVRGTQLKRRIDKGLELVGLSERAGDAVGKYSGGMKRRINMVASLLHEPKLIILDEPTVGIDPQSRNHIMEMIRELRKNGKTIIYSTHYMEEVEALCDDVAIIDHGKVVAQDRLSALLERYSPQAIYVEAEGLTDPPVVEGVRNTAKQGRGWVLESDQTMTTLQHLSKKLADAGSKVRSLELMRPSLESVFLTLTGTNLRN